MLNNIHFVLILTSVLCYNSFSFYCFSREDFIEEYVINEVVIIEDVKVIFNICSAYRNEMDREIHR